VRKSGFTLPPFFVGIGHSCSSIKFAIDYDDVELMHLFDIKHRTLGYARFLSSLKKVVPKPFYPKVYFGRFMTCKASRS